MTVQLPGKCTCACFMRGKELCAAWEDRLCTYEGATKKFESSAHDMAISGLAWCAKTEEFVSCSHDRHAYLWRRGTPYQVTMKTATHGLTCCAVSPLGDRFVIGSACGDCCLCGYVEAVQMYVSSKSSRMFESLAVCCGFHEAGKIYAAGGANGSVQIYAGMLEGEAPEDTFAGTCAYAKDTVVLHTLQLTRGRINALCFLGDALFATASDATVYKITFQDKKPTVQALPLKALPLTRLAVHAKAVYGAGEDGQLYKLNADFTQCVPLETQSQTTQAVSKVSAMMNKFNAASPQASTAVLAPVVCIGEYDGKFAALRTDGTLQMLKE